MRPKLSGDLLFKILTTVLAASAAVILIVIAYTLFTGSLPVLKWSGLYFFTGTKWNAVRMLYGALPYMLGTLVTSAIALIIAVPISLGIAIFLADMAPSALRVPISYLVELLAAVPSVIFGLWGLFVMRFWVVKYIETPLSTYLGWFPAFSGTPFGLDVLNAGIILAIMIIPIVSSISREIIQAVPNSVKEGAYSIGATRWEVIRNWELNYGRSGIFGAVILGLGRAVGETMAVTMLIGNAVGPAAIPISLLKPGQTMASLIANDFAEATRGSIEYSAYIGVGLFLLLVTLSINVIAHFIVARSLKIKGGAVE
ncbi:MAG TPA: phosphate ABC transporter permease subunit PstC [archaeon]|nr:phosphate ABC transporter permease subunit PstC [archaeon]